MKSPRSIDVVIARSASDEAIQGRGTARAALDRHVAPLLAMTMVDAALRLDERPSSLETLY
jgi:hypothetical protein